MATTASMPSMRRWRLFTILSVAVLFLFPLSIYAVGGFKGLVTQTPPGFFRLLSPPYGGFDWFMFALLIAVSYNATWALVQKYNCVATEADAKKVALTMVVLSAVGFVVFFLPAIAARVLLPELGATPDGSKYTYVALSLKLLPPGLMGLMVAGMFSATLSTLGSDYNVLSGVLTKDFYGRMVNPGAGDRELIKWGRINTAIIGVITIFCAIGINYIRGLNLYDIMNKAIGALGPAIMLPLLGGLFVKKLNSRGAVAGVLFGTVSGVGLVVLNLVLLGVFRERLDEPAVSYWLKQGYNSLSIGVNILVTILGMWLGSSLMRVPEDETARVKDFFRQMDIPTEPEEKAPKQKDGWSPFYAVGLAVMVMGIVLAGIGVVMYFKGDTRALVLDFMAGGIMFIVGFPLWIRNIRRM